MISIQLILDDHLSINFILQVSCFKQMMSAFYDALPTFNCRSCATSPLTIDAAVLSLSLYLFRKIQCRKICRRKNLLDPSRPPLLPGFERNSCSLLSCSLSFECSLFIFLFTILRLICNQTDVH